MKKKKSQYLFMIISFIFFICMVVLLFLMRDMDRQTEKTTVFYSATVTDVAVTGTETEISARICTKEYAPYLYITNDIAKNICIEDVKNLEIGQTILFGMPKADASCMNEDLFVLITSLKTDTKTILSLEEYNNYMHESITPARITGIVAALIFLSISLHFYLKIRKSV